MSHNGNTITRRDMLVTGLGMALSGWSATSVAQAAEIQEDDMKVYDPVQTELVLNLVVTCSSPELIGPTEASKDGQRRDIWPIIGGRFEGKGIRGAVVPGGGDFPLMRPDGVIVIDALYRLKTDDGITIIIHNKGLMYPAVDGAPERYRLVPEFTAPVGKYDWLNKSIFISTLVDVPPAMRLAKGENENDRLIQVFRVF
jgi:Protein of unknown function (DUF3237)